MVKVGTIDEYTPGCDALAFHASKAREILILAPRKSGKTFSLIYDIVMRAWNNDSGNDILVCAPTYSQLGAVLEEPTVNALVRMKLLKTHSYSKHNTTLINGNKIRWRSLDNPDTIRGLTCHRVYIDEAAYCPATALDVVKPTMATVSATQTRPNSLVQCTTPNGVNNWFFERYYASSQQDPEYRHKIKYSKENNPFVDEEELQLMRETLDPLMIKQELEAQFVNLTENQVYYQFSDENIQDCGEPDRSTFQLHIGVDYNIGVMAYVVTQRIKDVIYVYDEGVGSNTVQDLGKELLEKYGSHNTILIDDASGNARNQADGRTNRQILRQIGFHSLYAPQSNPAIAKRLAVVNGHFLNGLGERRLLIHPKCKHLINELQTLSFKKNSTDIDDRGNKVGHITSALGYVVYYLSGGNVPREIKRQPYTPSIY